MSNQASEIQKKFKVTDEKMHQLEKDLKILEEFLTKYPSIIENLQEIEDYYFSEEYRKDLAELEKEKSDHYWSASEDGIWNLGIEFRSLRIQILKQLMDHLYKDTLKIEL